MGPQRNLAWG